MPTPKKRYLDSTPVVTKQRLATMNKQANARERNIAKAYLEAGPNIVNLAKAAYHWYNSVPWLGGKDENGNILVTGEVPTPGMRSPKSIVKGVRVITSSKSTVKGVRTITKANAHKITPKQWTAAQDAAIARGDIKEAQRLRDLHFRTYQNGDMVDVNGNPIHVYHGSPEKNITEFYKPSDPRYKRPKGRATLEEGIYTSPSKGYSSIYAIDLDKGFDSSGRVYDLYSNTKQLPITPNTNINYASLSTKEANLIRAKGYNGITDGGEHVVLEPNQLKLADVVTYDDKGVRIPLGERDNFKLNDIRYGLIPIIGGGIGYGLYKKSNKNKNIR